MCKHLVAAGFLSKVELRGIKVCERFYIRHRRRVPKEIDFQANNDDDWNLPITCPIVTSSAPVFETETTDYSPVSQVSEEMCAIENFSTQPIPRNKRKYKKKK